MISKSSSVALLLLLACLGARAQSPTPASGSAQGPSPYGNGEAPRLDYAGRSSPRNVVSLEVAGETAYDNNVLNDNARRLSDGAFAFSGRLAFQQERQHLRFALDYQPDVLLYRETRGRNALDHGLKLDMQYTFNPRFALRVRESLHYRTGVFYPRSSHSFLPELSSPTRLNDAIFTPLTRSFQNNLRLDAVYRRTRRTSFNLFGGLLNRNFLGEVTEQPGLRDHHEVNAGLQHLYRLSRDSTLGTLYLFQDMRFGEESYSKVHSVLFSFARQLSPGTTVHIFGGPQYTRSQNRFTSELDLFGLRFLVSGQILRSGWHPALGGAVVQRLNKTVFQISARRTVTDSGGLLIGAVNHILMETSVRRRMGRNWHAFANLTAGHASAVLFDDSDIRTQTAGFGLERSLSETLTTRVGYNLIHQRSGGPIFPGGPCC